MRNGVVFVDTSVLVNVLRVPGSGNAGLTQSDIERFGKLLNDGTQLVLPLATIIETGNSIARVRGGERHRCTTTFITFLRSSLAVQAPWVPAGFADNTELLTHLLDGSGTLPTLAELMNTGVGTGDASILAEVAEFRKKIPSATPVEIWTHDVGLGAYT